VLEGSEAIEHQGFLGSLFGAKPLVEEQTVAAQALRLML
jgi:hypothetical protein